jgi:hypothetical protein
VLPSEKTFKTILGIVLLMIPALLSGLGFWADAMGMHVNTEVNIMLAGVTLLLFILLRRRFLNRAEKVG